MATMKTWRAYGVVSGSKYLGTFEAETESEAMDMAANDASVRLCHHCAREVDGAEVTAIEVEETES